MKKKGMKNKGKKSSGVTIMIGMMPKKMKGKKGGKKQKGY